MPIDSVFPHMVNDNVAVFAEKTNSIDKTCLYRILQPGRLQKHSPALKLPVVYSQQGSGKTNLASKVASKIDTLKDLHVLYNNYECIYVKTRTNKQEGVDDGISHDPQVSVIWVLVSAHK